MKNDLETAVKNVVEIKTKTSNGITTYKHISQITDDKFREMVELIKDATKNKYPVKDIKNALAKELYNLIPESETLYSKISKRD